MRSLFLIAVCLCGLAEARHPSIIRGGTGFLLADANSFQNPGENALNHGLSLETRAHRDGNSKITVGPSASFSYRGYTVGGFYSRVGTDVQTSGQYDEIMGGALGTEFLFRRLTVGMTYTREVQSGVARGNLLATATGHLGRIDPYTGLLLGLSVNQELGIDLAKTAWTFAVGKNIERKTGYEFDATWNDIYDTSDWTFSVHRVWLFPRNYLGAGLRFGTKDSVDISLRGGIIRFRNHVDLSAYFFIPTSSRQTLFYGLSARAIF